MDFNDAMRAPAPKSLAMPPPRVAPSNAAQVWLDAIAGKAPQMGLGDNVKAAQTWLGQQFNGTAKVL